MRIPPPFPGPFRALLACLLLAGAAIAPATAQRAAPRPFEAAPAAAIGAVVNGDVISASDVENRRRLFALSTNLPMSTEVLDRLTPQVTRQLIDERLRLQELQRRGIVVGDADIAKAIADIEAANGMAPGVLRRRLASDGVQLRTMIDQLRVQLGWSRLLRDALGRNAQVTPADIAELEAALRGQTGQTEYRVGEIFVPIGEARQGADAQRFADTIIAQLRAGAPFGVVAAQFSQGQAALQGGDLGWVQGNQVDGEVLRVLQIMPQGAISNPIRVPGGISIVTLRGKRVIGSDNAVMATVRQAFFPFTARLDPANPTDEQRRTLERARALSASARSCEDIERANAANGDARPADPGELRIDAIASPPLRELVGGLAPGRASQPLIAEDGIAIVMVCTRETRNLGIPSQQELSQRILSERVELAGRQLMRDLQRRAVIDQRS